MEGIVALIMIFGMPVAIVGLNKYFKFRTRQLEVEQLRGDNAEREQLEALRAERKLLDQRVQNLETIVTSVDFELNNRLNRLAARQSQLLLPEGHARAANVASNGTAANNSPATAATMALRAPAGALAAGTTLLGRFEVQRTLGHGGMGAVYLARDAQLGEQVALKVIAHNLAEDPGASERFRREVGAARKITHPNVIRIHDLGDDDGLLFLSMEYFAGMTLQALLGQRGKLPLDEARPLLGQVCDALTAAHQAGVVHRDLKPPNILVDGQGSVRVIDFGLAKSTYARTMTATGLIMGTPEYMSPEQVRGQPVDHRADIYSLAAVAFHALCGRPPFTADTPIAVGFMQCNQAPPAPRSLAPNIPEPLEQAILKGLSKSPAQRFDSAAAFRDRIL